MTFQRKLIAVLGITTSLMLTGYQESARGQAYNSENNQAVGRAVIPRGYNAFAVAIANGVSANPTEFSSADPADFLRCQSVDFQRTPEQIAIHRTAALQFFKERFGVNADDPTDDFVFESFAVRSFYNYRVYAIGNEVVPAEGYPLSDCGYRLIVSNVNGTTLGGKFTGFRIPVGSSLVFGDYAIRRPLASGNLRTLYVVGFKSATPLVFLPDGTANFKCELSSPVWGLGLAEGFLSADPIPGTTLFKGNARSVWTFSNPPLNGL